MILSEACRAQQAAYRATRKEKKAAYDAAHRLANAERIRIRRKAYREAHKEELKIKQAAFREANREKVKARKAAYYQANRDRIKNRVKARYHQNVEKVRVYHAAYYASHKEEAKAQGRAYRAIHAATIKVRREGYRRTDKARQIAREWQQKRLAEDPGFKLKVALRIRIWQALKRGQGKKFGSSAELLGCSIPQFREHLEGLFRPGMTWENYGPVWHVDHIKPCARFDLTDPAQQRACFHYTNTQPLFAEENLRKGTNEN